MLAAIESLEDLVAPLEEQEFLELLRTRTLRFERGSGRDRQGRLLDWQGLRAMIEAGTIPGESIRITKQTVPIPSPFYFEEGRVVGERLDRLMSQGASLIVERVNRHVPALAALCATIRSRTAEKVKVGVIATMGGGGALPFHFDQDDLLILQLEGSKRWRVSGPPVPYPVAGLEVSPPQTSEPVFEDVLRPGDLLFLPAGYWHQCDNEQGRSLHVGFAFKPITAYYAVESLLPALLAREAFRHPLNRREDATDKAALEADVKSRLVEQFREMLAATSLFGDAEAKSPTG